MGRQTLLAVAVAALLVTSGCSGLDVLADDAETPPDVDVAQRYKSLDTLEATRVRTVDTGNDTTETRALVRDDVSTDQRRQYRRILAPESRAGDVTVVDESGLLMYDASENAVTHLPWSGRRHDGNRSAYLQRVVSAARDGGDVAEPSDGVSPLPVVPTTGASASIPEDAIEGFEVEYLGTRTVAGRTAHGFELTAVSEAALTVEQTLWLDSQYYYPLHTTHRLDYRNRTIETSTRLENVTFDAGLPDDAFEFDVPENATVETLNVSTESFDSVSALRERVDFSVPDPAVPDGYEFAEARYVGGNVTQASLQYVTADDHRLTVTKTTSSSNAGGFTSGENVTVAGRDGQYLTTPRTKFVTWSCGDTRYAVVGTNLDKTALLAVADSVGCE
ncbi:MULTISPECIES: outer membrane lipoprotein carrier protein LolA [Halobacterium]|uniref:LolA family protein n=1 Tax=Halobacterium TaxID=2239 RepID=UPI00073F9850|nr:MULTISPECIES: outer membrane lipoprotein carrier protein LolA [Halobacterium]MCG1003063.1 outer membrane lipoprotein carrier protein LolA [Halobacterium noricense]